MKTKITLLIAFVTLSFTSCIKDHIGHGPDGKEVQLTSENYLYDGDLEKIYLTEQITRIDNELAKLEQDDPKRKELSEQQANFQQRIEQLIDLSSIFKDFPIPCDNPGGKCIPRFMELFVFSELFVEVEVLVRNENGKPIGLSDKLVDLPGFENDLQYIRIPVNNYGKQITVEIIKKDIKGEEFSFKLDLNN